MGIFWNDDNLPFTYENTFIIKKLWYFKILKIQNVIS
jgi:hypothetical protein